MTDDYVKRDLKNIWHPCSQMKDYETLPPIVIDHGKGSKLFDIDGNEYIDCISSWWANIFGHSNDRINGAISKQLESLEHAIFANFSNKPAIELAEKLVSITPDNLTKVYFSDNGSSAVEIALKMSFHYHQLTGNPQKTRFASISDGYHGETLGAMSVGDLDLYNKIYKPLLLDTLRVEGPDCFRCTFDMDRSSCSAQCFVHMEKAISDNAHELAAVIIEPMVQGAAGMKIYSPVYLKKLRKLCDDHDVLLIADEIAVGFGRTGKMFACEHAGISPDLMCLSKGLTAGYMPMAVVMAPDKIYDVFYGDYGEMKAFLHSHTYAGNAMACAIALESLKIFEDDDILRSNEDKGKLIKELANEAFSNHPNVGEVRSIGMITAIELVESKSEKISFEWQKRVGYRIYEIALKKGLLLRPLGNVIYFMPPYVTTDDDIHKMIRIAKESMEEYFG